MVDLNDRLNEIIAQNPEKYRAGTIERVGHVVCLEQKNNMRRYRFFATIDDFMLYYEIHPRWHNKAPSQLLKIKGGNSFYGALIRFLKGAMPDKEERSKTYDLFFKKLRPRTRYDCKSLEEWINAYQSNPVLRGKSVTEFKEKKNSDGTIFYSQFYKWVCETAETKKERFKMLRAVMPRKDGNNYETFEDWKAEFKTHPKWAGRSPREMYTDAESGAAAFYEAYRLWVKKTTLRTRGRIKRETARRKLIHKLLKFKKKGWLN